MTKKFRITWLESERGWGQKTFTTDYESLEKAVEVYDKALADNPPGPAPDYYIQPEYINEIVIDEAGKVFIGARVKG